MLSRRLRSARRGIFDFDGGNFKPPKFYPPPSLKNTKSQNSKTQNRVLGFCFSKNSFTEILQNSGRFSARQKVIHRLSTGGQLIHRLSTYYTQPVENLCKCGQLVRTCGKPVDKVIHRLMHTVENLWIKFSTDLCTLWKTCG